MEQIHKRKRRRKPPEELKPLEYDSNPPEIDEELLEEIDRILAAHVDEVLEN